MFSRFPYFHPKLFGFSCIRLLVCFCIISTHLLEKLFPLFCNVLFCPYCFTLCRSLLNLSSFVSTSCLFPLVVLLFFHVLFFFFFVPSCSKVFLCFYFLACYCRFFIHVSTRITYPSFDFFSFVLLQEIPIFSKTNFAPA